MLRFSKRLFVVNLLGALFYLCCLTQWMWSLLPFMPAIIQFTQSLQTTTGTATQPAVQVASNPPSPLITIFGIIVVVVVIGIVIYIAIKTPTAIGKTGHKLTTSASKHIVPVISHHKKLSPQKRRQLTARVVVYVKITLSTLPVILGSSAYFVNTDLPYDVIMLIAAILGIAAFGTLCMQLSAAKILKVDPEKIW